MPYTLKISLEAREGALLRLLGLIQRRSFTVESIDMPLTEGLDKTVTVTVMPMNASYHIEILKRQIERLQEVREVTIKGEP